MTLTCCQDHILTENIWFVWSETSYSGDERRCYRCGTNERTLKIESANGSWRSSFTITCREVDLADKTRVAALPSSCPPGQPPLGHIGSLGTYRIVTRVPLGRIFRILSSSASSRPICLNIPLPRLYSPRSG